MQCSLSQAEGSKRIFILKTQTNWNSFSSLYSWMHFYDCTLYHILYDTFFPSIFLDSLAQTSAIPSQIYHPPGTV